MASVDPPEAHAGGADPSDHRGGAAAAGDPLAAGALVSLALEAAGAASDLLVAGLDRVRASITTKSTATDLVTEMDRASERLIVETILATRPDDAIVGEEGTDHAGTSGVRWIVDPLDGTTNYVYGHPGFAVSIAAEVGGEVVAGVVADPLHGDVYRAWRGGGAHRNDEPIHVNPATDLAQALVSTGFGYGAARRAAQARVLTGVLPEVRDIRRMGAASVDLCSVACGRVDAFFERGLAPWDHAAGALVAREAGARVGDLAGGPPSSGFVLAAAPALFAPLEALLRSLGADEV